MRVFLTGTSGFIGSHTARVLLAAGCDVLALVRPQSSLWRVHDIVDRLVLLQADLSDRATLQPALAAWQPEACIHLAWYAEPGKYLHAPENVPALMASLALLDALIQVGCRQVVMVGTCVEYDTDAGWLREDGPTRPATMYAATKLSLSLIGQQIAAAAGINFAWARQFYLYGPYEDERRVVPALIRALSNHEPFPATHGEQVRDYLHVTDVASALWILVQQGAAGIFNIASGTPVTMRQLMETIGNILGRGDLIEYGAVPYREWEPRFICGDNQRLCSMGWLPHFTLIEGLKNTVEMIKRK